MTVFDLIRGVGRILVADLVARANAAGAKVIEITANPNVVGFYSRIGFFVTGQTSTRFGPCPAMTLELSRNADRTAISDLMTAFLRTVSFERGTRPVYRDLAELFIPDAPLIRNSGVAPEISTVDEFIRERQASVDAGALLSFQEIELSEKTEMFGNIAHRFSPYSKRGATNSGEINTRGVISTQFVRTPSGWRISAMAWDDERVGLTLRS